VTANVGGGAGCCLSLAETTALCAEITGRTLGVGSSPETRPGDVPSYISDCSKLFGHTSWRPQRDAPTILADIHAWIRANERQLERLL
jgi:CDP-paratose 2-epimerase